MNESRNSQIFWSWWCIRILLWTVVATLTHHNAPLDLIEWLSWGHQWQWGYPKHPPFPAWVAASCDAIAPQQVWPIYFISYFFTGLTILAAWRLAKEILPKHLHLPAVFCLEGLLYFSNDPAEFSNNVVLNTCWAWCITATYLAAKYQSPRWWLTLGVVVGVGLLTKYTMILPLGCAILAILLSRTYRGALRSPWPYLALLLAALLFLPHLLWLWESDFQTIRYAQARTMERSTKLNQITVPLVFFGSQCVYLLPVLLILLPSLLGANWRRPHWSEASQYVGLVVVLPVFLLMLGSLLSGSLLRVIWGSPLWTFYGVLVLSLWGESLQPWRVRRFRQLTVTIIVLMFAFTIIKLQVLPLWNGKVERPHFPGPELAEEVQVIWSEHDPGSPPIVAGEAWRAGCLCCYLPNQPKYFSSGIMGFLVMEEADTRWVNDAELNRVGGVIVWDADQIGDDVWQTIQKRFPKLIRYEPIILPYSINANIPPTRVGIAIVPPTSE